MTNLGIVAALKGEARDLLKSSMVSAGPNASPRKIHVQISGIGPDRAAGSAHRLISMGVDALVSWGTAGGLDAALRPGDLILPETIISTDGELLSVDPVWHRHMRHRLAGRIPCRTDPIVESTAVLQNPYEKTLLRKRTGAAAVDMESAAMARVAHGASLPFLVVRAVTDPADLSLPRFVLEATDSSGTVDPLGVITGLIRSPKEILPLIRLAGCFRTARRTLREVLRWAGEDLMAPQNI